MSEATLNDDSVRSLSDFHANPRYSGDCHRADMAWALHAASRGLPEQQIRDEILHARDLSKKGGPVAPARLRATNRQQSAQHGQLAPLSARLRYGRRGENRSPHDAGAPAVPASLRFMLCAVAPLQARQIPSCRSSSKSGKTAIIDARAGWGYDAGHEILCQDDRTYSRGGDTRRMRFHQSYRADTDDRSGARASKSDLGV